MVWSNWQGAIWRGAIMVLLLWTGLAWTQAPAQRSGEAAERIMVVHENGKATRCRVLETWQLPDRRVAHLLQSTETSEMITIVDENPPAGEAGDVKDPKAMAKRIYSWGTGRRTPPDGSPVPPQFSANTKHEANPPSVIKPVIQTQVVDLLPPPSQNVAKPMPNPMPVPLPIDPPAQPTVKPTVQPTVKPTVQPTPAQTAAPLPPIQQPQIIVDSNCAPVGQPPVFPRLQAAASRLRPNGGTTFEPSSEPRVVCETTVDPNITIVHEPPPGTIIETKNSWRPGDKLQSWLLTRNAPKSDVIVTHEQTPPSKSKVPFSTAMPMPENKKPEAFPLAMGTQTADDKANASKSAPTLGKNDMWGNGANSASTAPGKSLVDNTKKVDPLLAPERITPKDDRSKAPTTAIAPPPPGNQGFPPNSQSVLAARSGMQGQVTYVPYPIVTVPQPHHPPVPPAPTLPDAPNLTAYVNAFTPPPAPKGQANPGQPNMMPQGNPMLAQQQMMQQQMRMQQMAQQQGMMPNGNGRTPTQGPMANMSRQYQGPLPPNLSGSNGMMQAGFVAPNPAMMPPNQPMMPQHPAFQPVAHQQPMQAPQSTPSQQIDLAIKAMRESPYPSQREWAAQQLVSFDWRANPQVLHAMLQSASQDPAASVRAGCVYCLGRMQANVEPVLGTLNSLRNDADPRVRQEVEQTIFRLGHTPAAPK